MDRKFIHYAEFQFEKNIHFHDNRTVAMAVADFVVIPSIAIVLRTVFLDVGIMELGHKVANVLTTPKQRAIKLASLSSLFLIQWVK
jgi:hypothetical protein